MRVLGKASVLHAMNEINAARRMREAAMDKAEADKVRTPYDTL